MISILKRKSASLHQMRIFFQEQDEANNTQVSPLQTAVSLGYCVYWNNQRDIQILNSLHVLPRIKMSTQLW